MTTSTAPALLRPRSLSPCDHEQVCDNSSNESGGLQHNPRGVIPRSSHPIYTMSPPTRAYQGTEAMPAPTAKPTGFSMQQKPSHKRKRDSPEHNGTSRTRTANGLQGTGGEQGDQLDSILLAENPEFANLAQHLQEHTHTANNVAPSTAADALRQNMPSLTVPQPTDLSFQSTNTVDDEDQGGSSFNLGPDASQNHHSEGAPYNHGSVSRWRRRPSSRW